MLRIFENELYKTVLLNRNEPEAREILAHQNFLAPAEREYAKKIKNGETRENWLIGRFLLKFLLAVDCGFVMMFQADNAKILQWDKFVDFYCLNESLLMDSTGNFTDSLCFADSIFFQSLLVVSRDENNRGIPPVIYRLNNKGKNERINKILSLSHAGNYVLAALSSQKNGRIGCDLMPSGSVQKGMLSLFFTEEEQIAINRNLESDSFLSDKIWTVKEAVYKKYCESETFHPLAIRTSIKDSDQNNEYKTVFSFCYKEIKGEIDIYYFNNVFMGIV